MIRIWIVLGAMSLLAQGALAADSALETPKNRTAISGKQLFSGWHCDAEKIEIEFPDGARIEAAYGAPRADVVAAGKCDGNENVGFGVLYNMALLGTGEHTVTALADGEVFKTSTFTVVQLSPGAYLNDAAVEGATTTTTISDFPTAGHTVTLSWEKTLQNFVITNESIPSAGGADVLQDGVAASQYDAGIFAFDQALGYGACGGGPAPDTGCESIAFEVVDDADRGSVLEVSYLSDQFAGIVIDSNPPGLDMSAYETGVLKFDIKVVSAGENTTYKVKLDDHNGGSTGEFDVDADNSGSWATYSVNMSDLLVNVDGNGVGGDLSLNTLKAVVFMATFGATQDVVFRLDNVYFQQ